ncbi:MAG: amidohydrolase [Candidatus Eisenbacteria bacterium]
MARKTREAAGGPEIALVNANVITMDETLPHAEAFVMRDGRFIYVGTTEEVRSLVPSKTHVIDLEHATVLPGLTDSHIHLMEFAATLVDLDLSAVSSFEGLLGAVAKRAEKTRTGEWIFGRGWNETKWEGEPGFDRKRLDAVTPSNPTFLLRIDGHAAFVNSAALEAAGITRHTPDPQGGRILRDAQSAEATGMLIDAATELVRRLVPEPSPEQRRDVLELALNTLASNGLTSVHEVAVNRELLELLLDMESSWRLPVRVYGMLSYDEKLMEELAPLKDPAIHSGWVTIKGVKLFLDGALGSRGALLAEPYSDDKGNQGVAILTKEEMLSRVKNILRLGYQPAVHAIGDLANRIVLDVYEECLSEETFSHLRPRIEHAEVLFHSDVFRFGSLGIVASVQPIHLAGDIGWLESRLGAERVRNAFLWRSLLDGGARLISGSDCPIESPNPFLGLHAAVTRQNLAGEPAGGWFAGERLTVEEALRSYTLDAAYGSFQEHMCGSIVAGKSADFTIVDRDISTVPFDEIPGTRVLCTFVEGREIRAPLAH